jgi:pectin methylesterase-like acyl-CoA thioesterase
MKFKPAAITLVAIATSGFLAGCGGDRLVASETKAETKPVETVAAPSCAPGIWFCENFESGSAARWEANPVGAGATIGTADGKLALQQEGDNHFLRYDAGSSKGVAAVVSDAAFVAVEGRKTADYYVEARIKPISNTTSNKFVCLLGRYQDVNNWYGGCLNVQNGASSKVEFHKANAGKWFRARQFSARVIKNDVWYKLRLEMKGSALNFYIDDDLVGTASDTSVTGAGKIGFWLDNRSFAVDDIVVGDANVKPSLLSLEPVGAWSAEVGGADREVKVSASTPDGSADDFSITSSNPQVVSVNRDGNSTVLHAAGAGTAVVSYVSGSNPKLSKTVEADIEPAFVQADESYGKLADRLSPAADTHFAYVDTPLSIAFDDVPVLTGKGSLRIFRAADDKLVDVIKPAGETDAIGPSADGYYRGVAQALMRVDGKRLVVHPHAGKLEYATKYYVAIADGTLKGAKLSGKGFVGLGKKAGWEFTTRAALKDNLTTLTVAQAGATADFRTLQGALNYAMQKVAKETPVTIRLANGTYTELLYLRGKDNVTIRGESRDKTVVEFDNYEALNSGSGNGVAKANASSGGGRAVLLAEQSDLLTLERLTLKNSHLKVNGVNNQAEVIFFNGSTQRLVARDMNFISRQDTLQLNAYSWFYNTLIAGDVDFIWGSAKAALFENSEIRTVVDSTDATKGGYLVQARVTDAKDKGYVFLNSRLTREADVPDGSAELARSAGVPSFFDNVVYVNCRMDRHIDPAGWWINPIPNPADASAIAGWREFGSTALDGSPLVGANRVAAAHTLSEAEAAPYLSRAQVFSAIGWNPQP